MNNFADIRFDDDELYGAYDERPIMERIKLLYVLTRV